MPKDKKEKEVVKPGVDPNDYPDYGDFMKAKKELEAEKEVKEVEKEENA